MEVGLEVRGLPKAGEELVSHLASTPPPPSPMSSQEGGVPPSPSKHISPVWWLVLHPFALRLNLCDLRM